MSRFCVWAEDEAGNAIAVTWTECKSGSTAVKRLLKALTTEEYDRTERAVAKVPDFYDVDFVPNESKARTIFLDR